jgi:hypothetical protein
MWARFSHSIYLSVHYYCIAQKKGLLLNETALFYDGFEV